MDKLMYVYTLEYHIPKKQTTATHNSLHLTDIVEQKNTETQEYLPEDSVYMKFKNSKTKK